MKMTSDEPAVGVNLARLKITEHERTLLRNCHQAQMLSDSGNYLAAPRMTEAAEYLIARGFLSKSDAAKPGDDWIVVRLTPANMGAMRAEIAAAGRGQRGTRGELRKIEGA
jgi:hypothetical protein